jgi:hypothetical protein
MIVASITSGGTFEAQGQFVEADLTNAWTSQFPFSGLSGVNTINPVFNAILVGTGLTSVVGHTGVASTAIRTDNGSTSYLATTVTTYAPSNIFSFSFWIRPEPSAQAYRTILAAAGATTWRCVVRNDQRILVERYIGPGFTIFGALLTIPNNVWSHVAYTTDGITEQFYINGVFSNSGTHNPTFKNVTIAAARRIMYNQSGTVGYPFFGALEDYRVWARVLDAYEVYNLANDLAIPPMNVNSVGNVYSRKFIELPMTDNVKVRSELSSTTVHNEIQEL